MQYTLPGAGVKTRKPAAWQSPGSTELRYHSGDYRQGINAILQRLSKPINTRYKSGCCKWGEAVCFGSPLSNCNVCGDDKGRHGDRDGGSY